MRRVATLSREPVCWHFRFCSHAAVVYREFQARSYRFSYRFPIRHDILVTTENCLKCHRSRNSSRRERLLKTTFVTVTVTYPSSKTISVEFGRFLCSLVHCSTLVPNSPCQGSVQCLVLCIFLVFHCGLGFGRNGFQR